MTLKQRMYQVIFETDTVAGRRFDVVLLWTILFSVVVVVLESVQAYGAAFPEVFLYLEVLLTIIFTMEYALRIWSSPRPFNYIFSPWGIIDFLSILPTYLSLIVSGYHFLMVVRIFRLLRVFRILKLVRFNREARVLNEALYNSRYKISVFLVGVMSIVILLGTLMYVFEGGEVGFTSIPESIYWAIVTVTTVGYGDLVPQTTFGKLLSSIAMIMGYAIIAVPTGIVSAELSRQVHERKKCNNCGGLNATNAKYCCTCGGALSATGAAAPRIPSKDDEVPS